MSLPPSEREPVEIRVKGKAARIRGATWTNDQVKKLFQVWTRPDIYDGLQNEKKKLDIFKNMADLLSEMGVNRTWRECRAKMKNLKADFRKALEKKTQFKYYEDMKSIMNLDASSTELKRSSSIITLDRFFTPTRSSSNSRQSFGFSQGEEEQKYSQETVESIPSTSRSVETERYDRSRSVEESESSRHTREDSGDGFRRPSTEYDSSSRSSMVISHVVSNVIEPVTQVVMPSTSRFGMARKTPPLHSNLEILHVSPGNVSVIDEEEITAPPIQLEFLLQDENVILQQPRSSPIPDDEPVDLVSHRTSPVTVSTPDKVPEGVPESPEKTPRKRPPSPTRQIYPPKKSPAFRPPPSTPPIPKPKKPERKKRQRLVQTMTKTTAETISNLLTETSQNLLKELQEAEHRFICWEEEKRVEERKREELMFSKLVNAMQGPQSVSSTTPTADTGDKPRSNVVDTFSTMSKRINELVCEEVKGTEETMRQWEVKMQRQESKHTEKLFAMIINAIKTSSTNTE